MPAVHTPRAVAVRRPSLLIGRLLKGFRDVTARVANDVIAGGDVIARRARGTGVAVDGDVNEWRALIVAAGHAHRRPRDVVVMETRPASAGRTITTTSGGSEGSSGGWEAA